MENVLDLIAGLTPSTNLELLFDMILWCEEVEDVEDPVATSHLGITFETDSASGSSMLVTDCG